MGLGLLTLLALAAHAGVEVIEHEAVDLAGVVVRLAEGRAPAGLERFAGHPAVLSWKRRGEPAQYAAQWALFFEGPELKPRWTPPEHFAKLEGWDKELRQFARDTDFWKWRAAQPRSAPALAEALAERDLEKPLIDYVGFKSWSKFYAVASPWHDKGSSWIVEEEKGLPLVYVVAPPPYPPLSELAGDIWSEPVYAALYIVIDVCGGTDERRQELAWAMIRRLEAREFGHPFRLMLSRPERLLRRYEKQRGRWPDIVSYRDELMGRPCPMPLAERMQETVYARRVRWYEEARH